MTSPLCGDVMITQIKDHFALPNNCLNKVNSTFLCTITPASGFVGPAGALVIGILAGLLCFSATNFLKRVLKIDDSLDVFPVHGEGGVLGTPLAGGIRLHGIGYIQWPGLCRRGAKHGSATGDPAHRGHRSPRLHGRRYLDHPQAGGRRAGATSKCRSGDGRPGCGTPRRTGL